MTEPEATVAAPKRKRFFKRLSPALALLILAALGYRFLIIGDNWAADQLWNLAPMSWRISHLADKLLSNDPARSRAAEDVLITLRSDADITAFIYSAASRLDFNDDRSRRPIDVLARIGAPAVVPLMKATSGTSVFYAFTGRVGGNKTSAARSSILSAVLSLFVRVRYQREQALYSARMDALYSMGWPAVKPLTQFLTADSDPYERQLALRVLASTKNPDATAAIIAFAESTISGKEAATSALALHPCPAAADFFAKVLSDTDDPHPGKNLPFLRAAVVLGRLKDPRAVWALMVILRSAGYADNRSQCAALLANYSGNQVEAALAAALDDPDKAVSDAAAASLEKISTPSAKDALARRKPRKDDWRE